MRWSEGEMVGNNVTEGGIVWTDKCNEESEVDTRVKVRDEHCDENRKWG